MPKSKAEIQSTKLVMRFERKEGRHPQITKRGSGYDIKSDSRCIEVKGKTKSSLPGSVKMNKSVLRTLGKNVKNYYIYIVYDLKKKPKLLILPSEVIFSYLGIDPLLILHPKKIRKSEPSLRVMEL